MCSRMDQERMEGEEVARMVQGSLLNRVYEVQCDKERQFHLISQMMKMSVSPGQAMDENICQTQGAGGQVQQDMEVGIHEAIESTALT